MIDPSSPQRPVAGGDPRPPPRRLRHHWSAGWRGGLTLVGACLALHLPGIFSLPPIDRDEPRFAEASRRMAVATGWRDRIVPTIQDRPRLKKPPLIYWLQAPVAALLGTHEDHDADLPTGRIWAYRLPSVLGALAAVLVTWRLGCDMFAPPVGWLAGLLLGASAVVLFDVRQARADQVLLAFTALAYLSLWKIWRARDRRTRAPAGWVVALWLAVGLGAMTKGPITPALVALSALALSLLTRQWRWLAHLRPVPGGLVLVGLVAPWLVAVGLCVGWRPLGLAVLDEVLLRSITPKEGHWGPPGTYLVLLPVLFWPGSLALVPGLRRAFHRSLRPAPYAGPRDRQPAEPSSAPDPARQRCLGSLRRRWQTRAAGRAAELFCLAWLVPGWVVFELLVTKLPHYTLPLYPALALLCARGLFDIRAAWLPFLHTRLGRTALWGWVALSELIAVGLPLAVAWLGRLDAGAAVLTAFGVSVAASQALLIALAVRLRETRIAQSQCLALVASAFVSLALFQLSLPHLRALWLSSRLVACVRAIDPPARRPLAAVGYHEDSLVFLTRGRIWKLQAAQLAEWLDAHPDGLVAITTTSRCDLVLRRVAAVEGFNYSTGRWQTIELLERPP